MHVVIDFRHCRIPGSGQFSKLYFREIRDESEQLEALNFFPHYFAIELPKTSLDMKVRFLEERLSFQSSDEESAQQLSDSRANLSKDFGNGGWRGRNTKMIKAILVFNNHGKPRLSKFFAKYTEEVQQAIVRETFLLITRRDDSVCNFLEGGTLIGGSDFRIIYRHYATLYFVFCVDSSESELGILDLIQVFVETLDKCFENVCELDLIFHVDKVHYVLSEIVMGGMVLETNMSEILTHIEAQAKLEKQEAGISAGTTKALNAVKNIGPNLPNLPNFNLPNISLPNLSSFKSN